ncbi:hypothetical protein ACFWIJ_07610, partial [Streptomyces sp. NPDC127079]|uniref:hypothetical protein n=1 Tax=Streptomyces sp. NPDC127079 TaxID=3347132 RepID=UPI00365850AE
CPHLQLTPPRFCGSFFLGSRGGAPGGGGGVGGRPPPPPGARTTLGPASLVMAAESVPDDTRWLGNPIEAWRP